MAEIATVGMLPLRKAHSITWIASDAIVFNGGAEHLAEHTECILDCRRTGALDKGAGAGYTEGDVKQARSAMRDRVGTRKAGKDEGWVWFLVNQTAPREAAPASALGVSRATVYGVLAESPESEQ